MQQLSGSGSGRILRLLSGTIRFRPDFKICYPVHIYIRVFPLCFLYLIFETLTMLWYSSHVFSSLSFHTHTLGSNFLRRFVLNRMFITNNLCFGTHSSFGQHNINFSNKYIDKLYTCNTKLTSNIYSVINDWLVYFDTDVFICLWNVLIWQCCICRYATCYCCECNGSQHFLDQWNFIW